MFFQNVGSYRATWRHIPEDSILQKQLYFVVSGLKSIGHRNQDNNLESPHIYIFPKLMDACSDVLVTQLIIVELSHTP
jgi:hypothetical protein